VLPRLDVHRLDVLVGLFFLVRDLNDVGDAKTGWLRCTRTIFDGFTNRSCDRRGLDLDRLGRFGPLTPAAIPCPIRSPMPGRPAC
jgi:hypothetical protein